MPRIVRLGPGYILHTYAAYKVVLSYSLIAIEYPDSPLPYEGHSESTRWTGGVFPYPATGFYTLLVYHPKRKEIPHCITTPDGRLESDYSKGDLTLEAWIAYETHIYELKKEDQQREYEKEFQDK